MESSTIKLVLLAVVGICAVTFGGTYSGGSGTAEDPYRISTAADWTELTTASGDWEKHFILTADIDLEGIDLVPVGNDDTEFSGVFDGFGHTIRNVSIVMPSSNYVGLFGEVYGRIKNLNVIDADIQGRNSVGGLVGFLLPGIISSCRVTGSITGGTAVGGLVGGNWGGTVRSSYSSCSVNGNIFVGGLIGHSTSFDYSFRKIQECYATGSVDGNECVGGLIGANQLPVTECYAVGKVSGNIEVGGLIGSNSGSVTASFWDVQTSEMTTSAGGTGKMTEEMQTLSTFTFSGWDFSDSDGSPKDWIMVENEYPTLFRWPGYSQGSGTENDPYRIRTAGDWVHLTDTPSEWDNHFLLAGDINLAGVNLTPVGDTQTPFLGEFNGNGHALRNVTILYRQYYAGLFGYVGPGGRIHDLGAINVHIEGEYYSGGLVGCLKQGNISSCCVTGSINGTGNYIGGLVGSNGQWDGGWEGRGGIISNCYTHCIVSSSKAFIGGIAGFNSGTIRSCYAAGSVRGNSTAYGFIGYYFNYNGEVSGCFWDKETGPAQGANISSTGITGKTTSEMQTLMTYSEAGWDFTNIWTLCEGMNYPQLRSLVPQTDWTCPDGVGLEDLLYLSERWMTETSESAEMADADNNGKVTISDFDILSREWALTDRIRSRMWHWPFDGSFDGLVSGVEMGDPVFVDETQSKVGSGAIELDGDDYVVMLYLWEVVSGKAARTCTAWIKTTGTIAPIMYWGYKGIISDMAGTRWDIRINSLGQLRLQVGGGAGINSVSAVNTGEWVHVAVVLPDGGDNTEDVLLYINGVLETGGELTAGMINTITNAAFRVGADENGHYFTGLIDDVRVYDRALSAKEIMVFATGIQ